jgi:hypothetical protein
MPLNLFDTQTFGDFGEVLFDVGTHESFFGLRV